MIEHRGTLEELALRRYASRMGVGEVATAGSTITLTVKQPVHDTLGRPHALARVKLVGRRDFGGLVHLAPAATVEVPAGTAAPDAEGLVALGQELEAVLDELCRCGQVHGRCDCCPTCRGRGTVPGPQGKVPCAVCAGVGYRDRLAHAVVRRRPGAARKARPTVLPLVPPNRIEPPRIG